MELKSEFRVGIPVEQAWNTLTDVEFIAPCMPGAQLTEVDGDEFKGGVKIKVGPITVQYKGSARFVELDEANHRVVLEATGRDSRGAGNAAAEVTAQMTPDGDGTVIAITTDLKVTGKVAQFGRGVMADVTEKLIGQFVDSLERKLTEAGASDAADATPAADEGTDDSDESPAAVDGDAAEDSTAETGPRKIEMAEPEPVDLLGTAGRPMLKRLLAPIAVVAFFLLNRRRRRKRRAQG
ncbi:SRPBCC family protein [Candidatus Poriferisodalis sp.]|uniref:SRPBCC family protein n=1 Tax=Candidatus Poriferisodalis sp. TaxID=3101277 RepID=UPI003D0AE011